MRWFYGLLVILCLAVSNQSCLELMKYQQNVLGYYQPTFTNWLNHSFLVLYLPIALLIRASKTDSPNSLQQSRSKWSIRRLVADVSEFENWGSLSAVSHHAIVMSVVYLIVVVIMCTAVAESNVTLVIVLCQSSCAFVVLLTAVYFCRLPDTLPMISVLVTMGGIVVVGLASELSSASGGSTSLLGIVCCTAYSASMGAYEVLWAERIGAGGKLRFESILTMLGLMGVSTIVLLWPTLWLFEGLSTLGVSMPGVPSKFEWPSDWPTWLSSIGIALTGLLYDLSLMGGISLTSALYMSVGSVLCIPTSSLTEWILRGNVLNWGQIYGAALILVGFSIFLLHEKCAEERIARDSLTWSLNAHCAASVPRHDSDKFSSQHCATDFSTEKSEAIMAA